VIQKAETRGDLRTRVSEWKRAGQSVALVPTMGNLHPGHLALVRAARVHAERVIASIYVNPTQFGEGEDFDRYPRTLESDLEQLDSQGCDLAFVPDSDQLYPFGIDRAVLLSASPDLAQRLEGRFRPGHFDGVVSVVSRLFAVVAPDVAVFGEKDYQQLLIIRRMAEDLGFDIEIVGMKTVRAESGLALSSRNAYLDPEQLTAAGMLNQALEQTARRAQSREDDLGVIEADACAELEQAGLRVEYVVIRRAQDLARPGPDDRELRVLAATWSGQTRLIDNFPLHLPRA